MVNPFNYDYKQMKTPSPSTHFTLWIDQAEKKLVSDMYSVYQKRGHSTNFYQVTMVRWLSMKSFFMRIQSKDFLQIYLEIFQSINTWNIFNRWHYITYIYLKEFFYKMNKYYLN